MSSTNRNVKPSIELSLLIVCSQTDPSDIALQNILPLLNKGTPEHNAFIHLANQHGVLPLVYHTCKKVLDVNNRTIQNFLSQMKPYHMAVVQKNMLMTVELLKLMKLLKTNGIEALSFKGPSLSQMAYGNVTLRQYGDLDILIRKKDRHKTLNLLLEAHFIPEIDLDEETKETFLKAVNVIGFHKPSSGVRVEVHWELLSKNYAISWKEESIWNLRESCQINQQDVRVLPFEQLILYLCVHGAKHLFERLEWICDIDRSIRANPKINWSNLLKEAQMLGIKRMLFLGLSLSQELFQLQLPNRVTQQMAEDKTLATLTSKIIELNFANVSQQGKSYRSFVLLVSMRENMSDKVCFAFRALFAPKFDDFKFIQFPKTFKFLYSFVRPIRLVMKYFNRS